MDDSHQLPKLEYLLGLILMAKASNFRKQQTFKTTAVTTQPAEREEPRSNWRRYRLSASASSPANANPRTATRNDVVAPASGQR